MKYITQVLAILLFLALHPFALSAQQAASDNSSPDTLKLGKRVFEQRCSVCHVAPTIVNTRTYGPALYKELVVGNEEAIADFIRNGSPGKMPGFKYGLEPTEIDAIVVYLKTLSRPPAPPPQKSPTGGAGRGQGQQVPED